MGAGHEIFGPSTSFTVTVNEHRRESRPSALCAFELTLVVPTSKAGARCRHSTSAVTVGHRPATFGAKVTTALHFPGALFTVIGRGHSIVGSGRLKFGWRSILVV
jgi:hypothetical protein